MTALAVLLGAVWYVQDALDSVDVTEGTLVYLDGGASDLWDGTVYLKADASVEVDHPAVTLAGTSSRSGGAAPAQKEGIRAIRLLRFPEPDRGGRAQRRGGDVLLAVEAIRREFPKLQVVSLGSADVIVTYVKARRDGRALHALKTAGVALVTFAGGGLLHHGLQPTMWM